MENDSLSFLNSVGGPKVVFGIIAAIVALVVLSRLFKKAPENPHLSLKRCSCGWQGQVSKYKPVCPKCASPLP